MYAACAQEGSVWAEAEQNFLAGMSDHATLCLWQMTVIKNVTGTEPKIYARDQIAFLLASSPALSALLGVLVQDAI